MKNLQVYLIVLLISMTSCVEKQKKEIQAAAIKPLETSTYYFIRHAEKDRQDSTETDPHLNETGKNRALRWSNLFKNTKFDAVYSTDYNRTRETASPTAENNDLEITIYDPTGIDVNKFKASTRGKNILVVGHSNTIPQFVNKMIGKNKYKDIDDNNNANFYMVTIVNDDIIDKVYSMD